MPTLSGNMGFSSGRPIVAGTRDAFPADARVVDNFKSALGEIFFMEHPALKQRTPEVMRELEAFAERFSDARDCWVYYPWRNLVIHTVAEPLYFRLRTFRNREVMTEREQEHYRNIKVGVAGLSVGSAILSAFVMSGGPRTMKIADFDVLEITNLNRIRAGLVDIGENKTWIAARRAWEVDPFADLHLFETGLNRDNLEIFLVGAPKLDIFVDEMDSLDLKMLARIVCRANRIPVLMATDNGDGVILDVERFDEEPSRKLFHGLVEEMSPDELKMLDFAQWLRLATKIVGPEYLTEEMQRSLLSVGKTVAGVPQLGTAASIAGSAVSFCVRRIAAKQPMPSGRYCIGLEEKMIPGYAEPAARAAREKKTREFVKKFSGS